MLLPKICDRVHSSHPTKTLILIHLSTTSKSNKCSTTQLRTNRTTKRDQMSSTANMTTHRWLQRIHQVNLPHQLLERSSQQPFQNKAWPHQYLEWERHKTYLHSPYTREHYVCLDQSSTPRQTSTLHLHNHHIYNTQNKGAYIEIRFHISIHPFTVQTQRYNFNL